MFESEKMAVDKDGLRTHDDKGKYIPKGKRTKVWDGALGADERLWPKLPELPEPVTKEQLLKAMINLIDTGIEDYQGSENVDNAIIAALFAARSTITDWNQQRVFIQDFAASLNRKELLSNTNVLLFLEYGYKYIGVPDT